MCFMLHLCMGNVVLLCKTVASLLDQLNLWKFCACKCILLKTKGNWQMGGFLNKNKKYGVVVQNYCITSRPIKPLEIPCTWIQFVKTSVKASSHNSCICTFERNRTDARTSEHCVWYSSNCYWSLTSKNSVSSICQP